jgi:hypothetical protein
LTKAIRAVGRRVSLAFSYKPDKYMKISIYERKTAAATMACPNAIPPSLEGTNLWE